MSQLNGRLHESSLPIPCGLKQFPMVGYLSN